MKLKSIELSGYRKMKKVTLNFDSSVTVLAGANNSGKTSIVELLSCIFTEKGRFEQNDMSVVDCQCWCDFIWPTVHEIMRSEETDERRISDICKYLFSDDSEDEPLLIQPIEAKLHIVYDPICDDIRKFADYLMDFDPACSDFYFILRFGVDRDMLRRNLSDSFCKLTRRVADLTGDEDGIEKKTRILKDMLVSMCAQSSKMTACFSDSSYENTVQFELSDFRKLFNFKRISAGRPLNDENADGYMTLSKNMVAIAREDADWNDRVSSLPDEVMRPIEAADIRGMIRKQSVDALGGAIESVSSANGGHGGKLVIDLDATEDAVATFLGGIVHAKYQIKDYFLQESSQGLGFSNLIYILLELEKYKKTIDPLLVNLFVVEEPESHMHPQMQDIFTGYLFERYSDTNGLHGLVTTHSHEVVRSAKISQLRVLRQVDEFTSKLYDLERFKDELSGTPDLLELYTKLYGINFSDILFSDIVIMYEGDTEKMLIRSLLTKDAYKNLSNRYVSFVQVGGAYAHQYKRLIDFLEIRTAVITDIDYSRDVIDIEDIKQSESTNATINAFYKDAFHGQHNPKAEELYAWRQNDNPIATEGLIHLSYQAENDGYTRTLEEAMLSKLFDIKIDDMSTKAIWLQRREDSGLKFSIPCKIDKTPVRDDTPLSLRDIVNSTSDKKTDFMYSVILNDQLETMLPTYIKEALEWLMG